ncbi:MAG TPA: serine hydrolase [Bryobacteraceae bacterium]|nr:serine hydrolase [Bryobacteraceae bacterium]
MRVLPLCLLVCATPLAFAAADYFPPPDSAGGWRTLKDAASVRKTAGMDLARLDQAFEYAQRSSQHGGLLVVRHGWLVYEKYYGKGNRMANPTMASVGKAYVSIACGIMLDDKKAQIPDGLDQKVFTEKYLPESFPLDDPAKADITLGQLLSMAAGIHGDGANPGFVNGEPATKLEPLPRPDSPLGQDMAALRTPLWTKPGGGYSYASTSPHIASIVLRHITGMELQQYLDEKLAKPMGWGVWGWGNRTGQTVLPHTNGGGGVAVHSTDALRFAYLLLHNGRWSRQQLVPASYVQQCSRPSQYQRHAPMSLMFEVNADGHVAGAPRDAYFKSGAGGFGIYVIPSLDMVIYKMAGNDAQYDPAATGIPQNYPYDGSRDRWKPGVHTQFSDGPIGVDDGVRRTLEMVVAAVIP